MCFNRLRSMQEVDIDFNWVLQVHNLATATNSLNELNDIYRTGLRYHNKNIIDKLENHFLSLDINRALNSNTNPVYRTLSL